MKISVLASGSKGNCTYLETENHRILIDLGMTTKYIEEKLMTLDVDPKTIDSVFLTHDHKDHISALKVFQKRYNPNIYLTEKLEQSLCIDNCTYLLTNNEIDSLKITVIKTSHDATDSVGFIFEEHEKSVVYITDTGYINVKYKDVLKNHNLYVLESNHDIEMLMNGRYRYDLKVRILGDRGHLSNEMATSYLEEIIGEKTSTIILAHLSEENNTEELAYQMITSKIKDKNIIIAKQNERTGLIEL
ncbi:MAG: MBL fold metallo-hydrolase [Bacilli bacterium]|nr:MBL fold metallo-hydrolase [Bacilli bacterium]